MPGLKTNEVAGTRAVLRHYRMSAYKARQVLDLIRGLEVDRADELLRSTPREAARVVAKVLGSAVSNARNNELLDPDELYVSACYADEGTTMKRWRPRARGRATRIRKRTCHITVIVSRLPEDRLERRRARQTERGGALRARRVAASRRAEQPSRAEPPSAEESPEPEEPELPELLDQAEALELAEELDEDHEDAEHHEEGEVHEDAEDHEEGEDHEDAEDHAEGEGAQVDEEVPDEGAVDVEADVLTEVPPAEPELDEGADADDEEETEAEAEGGTDAEEDLEPEVAEAAVESVDEDEDAEGVEEEQPEPVKKTRRPRVPRVRKRSEEKD